MWNSAAANPMRDDVALECCVTFPGMAACLVDLLLQVRKVCLERRAESAQRFFCYKGQFPDQIGQPSCRVYVGVQQPRFFVIAHAYGSSRDVPQRLAVSNIVSSSAAFWYPFLSYRVRRRHVCGLGQSAPDIALYVFARSLGLHHRQPLWRTRLLVFGADVDDPSRVLPSSSEKSAPAKRARESSLAVACRYPDTDRSTWMDLRAAFACVPPDVFTPAMAGW
jgi:hypothetical protein